MTTPGIDYSFSRPPPKAIHAAGFRFVVRYLDPGEKGLTRQEAVDLAGAGLWIACVYETVAEWMLGGHGAGVTAAQEAHRFARAAGMPDDRPVYFGADFDLSAGQIPAINDCLDGAASVLGRDHTGIYGGLAAVRGALDAKACKFAWQTLAWSAGVWDSRAQIRQTAINHLVDGQGVDIDEATADDYGQWQPGKKPQPPGEKVTEHVTGGSLSLAGLADQAHATPAGVLRRTVNHSPGQQFPANVAEYVNGVFRGHRKVTDPMPAGLHLWLPASSNVP